MREVEKMDGQNFENQNTNNYQDNTNDTQSSPVVDNTPANKTDALAIVSLVAGILAIVMACCVTYVGIVLGIVGIVCAVMSKKNNGKSGMATAGLICSIVGIVLAIIMIILAYAGLALLSEAGIDYSSFY